jgi:hypothetical protein
VIGHVKSTESQDEYRHWKRYVDENQAGFGSQTLQVNGGDGAPCDSTVSKNRGDVDETGKDNS